ncbi:hypothetical protein RMT89_45315, partial [Streptomyces sp. P17]|nr:hypothetical protein [Streptomyces sp. P17]
ARHFATGIGAQTLAQAPALTFNAKDRLQIRWAQAQTGHAPALRTHLIPSTHAFAEAARLGLSWGMNPEPLIRADLAQGR